MDQLDPLKKDPHQGVEIVAKEKQEFKFIGSLKKKRGQRLYELDIVNETFKEVKISYREAVDLTTKKEKGHYKAFINPNNYLTWALNDKNAQRKLDKAVMQKRINNGKR